MEPTYMVVGQFLFIVPRETSSSHETKAKAKTYQLSYTVAVTFPDGDSPHLVALHIDATCTHWIVVFLFTIAYPCKEKQNL